MSFKWRFEHVLAVIITAVLSLSLVGAFYISNNELINTIVTTFVGGLSAIIAYYFTKHKPDKRDDEQ